MTLVSDGLTEKDALGLEEVPHDEGHLRGATVEARTDEATDSLRVGAAENPLHEQAGLHLLLRALLHLHQSEHGLIAADMALGSHLVGETLRGLKSDQPHLGLLDVLFGLLPLGCGLGLLALRDDFVLLVLHAALAFLAGWVWVPFFSLNLPTEFFSRILWVVQIAHDCSMYFVGEVRAKTCETDQGDQDQKVVESQIHCSLAL